MMLNGCESTSDVVTKTHGSKAGDGYTYGTGPNKTRPYPQTEKVVIKGVRGATPKYEPVSRGGNKDYTVLGQNYMVWTGCNSYQEVGTASWYGPGFHGNKTSNGEVYNQKGYTAAHKNLPLPSFVKVSNLENGKTVIVRVNDRGPFHGSRIIDLSEGAAKAIDMTKKGTAKVKLELIDIRGGNISDKTQGSNIGQQIFNGVVDKVISQKNQDNLEDIGQYWSEVKNNGKANPNTTAAAVGAGLSIAGQLINAAQKNNSSSVTRTVTSTNSSGQVIDEQIDTINYPAPPEVIPNNYTIEYANPVATPTFNASYVQVFSSSTAQRAAALRDRLQKHTPLPVVIMPEDGLFRVRVGPLQESDLNTTLEYMKQLGHSDAFIKRL
ncbi:septal ring lytic transglycosylase RlpA family protein [Anaerobiospirillum sp. NML120448]|uniref:septal ring lytic transglycosylase RlpA family protein n=1 Tax=Anaerobiospirillum sp. NML120448 TaxID=2932816 RepID=UPI001FF4443B|nr:septal ring lytic transglycosylase RlpA family protein [Anaerobiospirillum sp. NML120448]MCK0514359.1 septal ring lytic transglycosylase RlpA family protein [Anaerobiospirillum sp. NML120448]